MYNILHINLTASKEELTKKIKQRVHNRGLDASFEKTEVAIMKKQLIWFKKYSGISFDISRDNWRSEAKKVVYEWYNDNHAA